MSGRTLRVIATLTRGFEATDSVWESTPLRSQLQILRKGVRGLLIISTSLVLGCGQFTLNEPYTHWTKIIAYAKENDVALASPSRLVVAGPSGTIRVRNRTNEKRGFVIKALSLYWRVPDRDEINVDVSGVEDGKTYAFSDDLHKDGPHGEIVVHFVRHH